MRAWNKLELKGKILIPVLSGFVLVIAVLAAVGIPMACILHGYVGFIFGSVKANALWMSPLMPVIFIMSAVVSGIALCMLTYIIIMEWRAWRQRRKGGSVAAGAMSAAIQ